ncbi:MAG TPA: DnaA N-terminal domain-containing protein, partial [Candidatus Binatia bacterium]|nr:DnaA N-terminal domain-containing protein [Candidatus Binatia bacterium]
MPHTIWLEARQKLRGELLDKDYDTWIEPSRAVRWSAGVLTLEVPSGFARDWLKNRLLPILERAVGEATGEPARVALVVNRALDVPAATRPLPPRRAERSAAAMPARYTFDNFVVSSCNQFAHAAARAVADRSRWHNPLYVYGGVGL